MLCLSQRERERERDMQLLLINHVNDVSGPTLLTAACSLRGLSVLNFRLHHGYQMRKFSYPSLLLVSSSGLLPDIILLRSSSTCPLIKIATFKDLFFKVISLLAAKSL